MDSLLTFTGTLDRRLFSTIWLPLHAFALALTCSLLDWRALLDQWPTASGAVQVAVAVGILATTTAAAYALWVLLPSVFGINEGRWLRICPHARK